MYTIFPLSFYPCQSCTDKPVDFTEPPQIEIVQDKDQQPRQKFNPRQGGGTQIAQHTRAFNRSYSLPCAFGKLFRRGGLLPSPGKMALPPGGMRVPQAVKPLETTDKGWKRPKNVSGKDKIISKLVRWSTV